MIKVKELVVGSSLNLIKNKNPNYDDEKMAVIKYGLEGLYLTISKTIIIFLIAAILGILKELIILTIIYNILRTPSFGMHASKSWICFVGSSLTFIGGAYLCTLVTIPVNVKMIVGIIGIILIFKNSPADTAKRPIVNPKRRMIFKIISSTVAISFVILSIIIPNNFWANCFILSLIIQCFMTAPTIYKLFGQSYDNYKNYIK